MKDASFQEAFETFRSTVPDTCRLRLAPTPSGLLHIGNALNFTLNYIIARQHPGGKLLLRIDDLDADRKRPEYVQDVFDTLKWLGISYDEGPVDVADFEQNSSQFCRLPLYIKLLEELRQTGLLYACSKSRRDLAPFHGHYPLEFRDQGLSLEDPDVAWRIATPPGFPLPDFVVRRRDGLPAYQVASLADDLHFGITHIIRGADLESSTIAQQFLAQCLGKQDFLSIQFLHHPLITDGQGGKLSKSAGASALKSLRENGQSPESIFQALARMLGLPTHDLTTFFKLSNLIYDGNTDLTT